MELVTSAQHRDSAGLGGWRSHSVKPRHSLALAGSVDYNTNNKEFRGDTTTRAAIERPRSVQVYVLIHLKYKSFLRHHLKANGEIDLTTTTLESFKEKRGERSGIEKPR